MLGDGKKTLHQVLPSPAKLKDRNLDTALADLASPALESGNLKPPWFDHSGITNSHNGSRQCYSLQPTSA